MFWIVHSGHLFLHRPVHGTGAESRAAADMRSMFTAWSLLVGNVFNLIVAPQGVGMLSDWFAGAAATDAASLRLGAAGARAHRILGGVSFLHGEQNHRRRSERAIGYVQHLRRANDDAGTAGRHPREITSCYVCFIAAAALRMPRRRRHPGPQRRRALSGRTRSGITASCTTWSTIAIRS